MFKKFDFEKLEVYQKTVDFTDKVFSITKEFSQKVQFSLGDQLRRAALLIANNIAEGSGRRHKAEKKQFSQTSLASAFECIPVLTISLRQKEIAEDTYKSMYLECYNISKMLSGLIKSVEKLD